MFKDNEIAKFAYMQWFFQSKFLPFDLLVMGQTIILELMMMEAHLFAT